MKPRAKEAFYTHYVRKKADAPSGLDTTYSWSSSGRGDTYSSYWRGSASVGVTTTHGVTTSHNGIGFLSTAALLKSGQVTWSQSSLVQNGEGGTGGGSWKVVHKERCRVCKDEVGMHEHQRLCYGCLEWYECYKHPGDHIEVSCPQLNGLYCSYMSYYKCSPHTHNYSSGSSTDNTPNCPDCTSHCSSPCSFSNSGTCNGSIYTPPTPPAPTPPPPTTVACGGAAWTGCTASVSSRTEHHVPSCTHCGSSYWTCSQWAYRHTTENTCRRPGCGVTYYACQNGPCTSTWGTHDYHWAE